MDKNKSIRRRLYRIATIIGTLYVILHGVLFIYTNDVQYKWDQFNADIQTKMTLLSKMKSDFGYGGAIHSFKNYLIRGKSETYEAFHKQYSKFIYDKNSYLQLDVSPFEVRQLESIEQVYREYKNNINKVLTLKNQGKSIVEIDNVVKIDDAPALKAMTDLENYFESIRTRTTNDIHDTIETIYYISLFAVIIILVLMFYFGRYFEILIMKPLSQIEEGLISFFDFLANQKQSIEPINLYSKDEFGTMAQSINKNIVIASDLHYDIRNKNAELENLLQSYGDNVIASKTDVHGVITYASEAFAKISGYSVDELVGSPHNIVRHPDMPKLAFKQMWDTLKDGETWEGEVKNLRRDGSYYIVHATISPMYDSNFRLIGYSAIREDVTQQKQVQDLNEQLDVYRNHLESKVKNATAQIEELMTEIEDTQKEVVFTMGAIGERRSEETGNHVRRVAEYSKILALYCGIDEKEAELLKQASPMHDIGKVGIADSILNKPAKFTPQERKIMQEHCVLGYNMLKSSKRDILKIAAIVTHEHHEKWDGTGYPQGLKGEEIHLYGRITALADVFDALGSDRVYKKAWDDERIFEMFKEERGKHFDPKLVDIFFEHLDEFIKIRSKFQD